MELANTVCPVIDCIIYGMALGNAVTILEILTSPNMGREES